MPISSMRQPPVGQIRASLRLVPQVLKSLRADGEDDLGGFADGPGASGKRACSSKIQMRFACVCLRLSTGKNAEAGTQTTQPANKNKKSGTPRVEDRRPDRPKLRTTSPVAAHHGCQARNVCLPPLLLLNLYLSQAWLYGQRREESDVETRIWNIEVMRYTERLKQ